MTTPLFGLDSSARQADTLGTDPPLDRLATEQFEQAERRRAARREMQADHSSAAERVRAWERLHGLQLPRDPNHPVLRVVALDTGLSIETVLQEQRQRSGSA
jgi:hypothetical protein